MLERQIDVGKEETYPGSGQLEGQWYNAFSRVEFSFVDLGGGGFWAGKESESYCGGAVFTIERLTS